MCGWWTKHCSTDRKCVVLPNWACFQAETWTKCVLSSCCLRVTIVSAGMLVYVQAHTEIPSLYLLHSNAELCLQLSQSSASWKTDFPCVYCHDYSALERQVVVSPSIIINSTHSFQPFLWMLTNQTPPVATANGVTSDSKVEGQ